MTQLRIAVTGAAGQIAYNLLFRIASGEVFGRNQPIALHLLELPQAMKALEGVVFELEDCAYPLLEEIVIGSETKTIFRDVHWALLVGAKPRGPGMERKDLLLENAAIFSEQGKALDAVADRDVRVLVVGNPCNTNAWIAMKSAPSLPKKHFFSMMRLDENRAKRQLALRAQVPVHDVTHMVVWGNHSSTQVPDFFHARIQGKPITDWITDGIWLQETFIETVQKRGAEIIAARGKSSAASAANAVVDTIHSLLYPTKEGDCFSLGVSMEGNPYGIDEEIICSVPCRSSGNGGYTVVEGLGWNDFLQKKIALSIRELQEEREGVKQLWESKS